MSRLPLRDAASRLSPSTKTGLDIWAFVVPAVSFLEITIIGRLIVTEILLLLVLPWLWRAPDRPPLPRWFVVLWAGWLLSQIVTDLVVGSAFVDYARGWAGIVFTLTNFVGILALVATPRRARLFAMGLAAGGLLGYIFFPHPYAAFDPWKWALALPVGLIVAAGLSGRVGDRLPWLTVVAFLAFGTLNLVLGYRSLGGVSLLAAGYLSLCAVVGRRESATHQSPFRAVLGLAFLATAGIAVLGLYSAAASQGLLGPEVRAKYADQAGALGVILGGRADLLVSTQAILDSPVLGHGSWAKDPHYAQLLVERQIALGYAVTREYVGAVLIPAHSYLSGAWIWAGFLGALFWFAVATIAVWLLANLFSLRVEMAPLLVLASILLLWDIAFSPYGLTGRITAPYGLAVCLLGLRLLREKRQARLSLDQAGQSLRPTGSQSLGFPRQSSQRRSGRRSDCSMRVKQDASRVVSAGTGPLRISVIVPSYNSGAYLRQALASALEQVPGSHEVIVQDGGSTDDTLEILRSFGERVTWVSAPDDGQSDALNKSLARATGDVVVWLNADDILLPGSLAAAAHAFESDPDLAFAYGDFDIIGSSGEVLRSYQSSPFSWMRIFARGCYIFSGSLFVRRQALLAVGGLDPTLRACMDFDLMLRLDAAGRSKHLGRTIGQLRMHGTNKSSTMLSLFFSESFRVRKRYARRSIRLWLVALWSTAIQGAALAATPLRYSTRWPRHGRGKTL